MITPTGPNRVLVIAVYLALVVAAFVIVGCRVVSVDHPDTPTGVHNQSADAEGR